MLSGLVELLYLTKLRLPTTAAAWATQTPAKLPYLEKSSILFGQKEYNLTFKKNKML